jgi:hypothetical protein
VSGFAVENSRNDDDDIYERRACSLLLLYCAHVEALDHTVIHCGLCSDAHERLAKTALKLLRNDHFCSFGMGLSACLECDDD